MGKFIKTPETEARRIAALKAKYPKGFWFGKKRPDVSKKMSERLIGKIDEKTPRWLGDNVGYDGLHDWVYKRLGSPMICEECGKKCKSNYQIHWANKSGRYKRDTKDWIRLCVSCHYKYDQGHIVRKRNSLGQFI